VESIEVEGETIGDSKKKKKKKCFVTLLNDDDEIDSYQTLPLLVDHALWKLVSTFSKRQKNEKENVFFSFFFFFFLFFAFFYGVENSFCRTGDVDKWLDGVVALALLPLLLLRRFDAYLFTDAESPVFGAD
jgi:hypothetical protein